MKMSLFLLRLICLSTVPYFPAAAGGENPPVGARAAGMANASLTLQEEWAYFNNMAGLAGLKERSAGISFENRFHISAFSTGAFCLALPGRKGTAGLGISAFGDQLYKEQKAGIAYAGKIRFMNLGMKAEYLQITIEETGTRRAMIFSLGGIAELSRELVFGAHLYNFNQAGLLKTEKEKVPVIMKAGISWRPHQKLMINAETEKDIDHAASFKGGMEYTLIEKFFIRTGVSTYPFASHFGTGITKRNFSLNYAWSIHSKAGYLHHLSLAWKINRKEKTNAP